MELIVSDFIEKVVQVHFIFNKETVKEGNVNDTGWRLLSFVTVIENKGFIKEVWSIFDSEGLKICVHGENKNDSRCFVFS